MKRTRKGCTCANGLRTINLKTSVRLVVRLGVVGEGGWWSGIEARCGVGIRLGTAVLSYRVHKNVAYPCGSLVPCLHPGPQLYQQVL